MQHPLKTLFSLISVFGVLALMAFVYPKDGIQISKSLSLKFPALNELLDTKKSKTDISKILELADEINKNDSLAGTADSLSQTKDTAISKLQKSYSRLFCF